MSEIVASQTYYIYTLAYPEGKVFYVGKGAQGRIADHEREASKGCKCRKCHVIREIWAGGKPVQKRIVYETLDESEAFGHERMLIDKGRSSRLLRQEASPFAKTAHSSSRIPTFSRWRAI